MRGFHPTRIAIAASLVGVLLMAGCVLAGWLAARGIKRNILPAHALASAYEQFQSRQYPQAAESLVEAARMGLDVEARSLATEIYLRQLQSINVEQNPAQAADICWDADKILGRYDTDGTLSRECITFEARADALRRQCRVKCESFCPQLGVYCSP